MKNKPQKITLLELNPARPESGTGKFLLVELNHEERYIAHLTDLTNLSHQLNFNQKDSERYKHLPNSVVLSDLNNTNLQKLVYEMLANGDFNQLFQKLP